MEDAVPQDQQQGTHVHASPVQYLTLILVGMGMVFGVWGKCDSERKYSRQQAQIEEIRARVLERGSLK